MPLSEYKLHHLWQASLNGDYKERIWLRDSFFILLYYIFENKHEISQKALNQILALLNKNEGRPYICFDSELNPVSVKNFQTGESADIQNDVIGELFWIYHFAKSRVYNLGKKWTNKINELIDVLYEDKYWEQPDSGMWEMEKDVRASSIGICVGGLQHLSTWAPFEKNDKIEVLIKNGQDSLNALLPMETPTRDYDAALLNLIWPFKIVNQEMAIRIIGRTIDNLKGEVAIKRFLGDPYYNCDGKEAEWALFVPQMLLSLKTIGLYPKNEDHNTWKAIQKIRNSKYPESFVCNNKVPNKNTPLAWTHAMCLLADNLLGYKKEEL